MLSSNHVRMKLIPGSKSEMEITIRNAELKKLAENRQLVDPGIPNTSTCN